jgi:hypothetical protein
VSVGSVVKRATYHAVGRVTAPAVSRYESVLVSNAFVKDMMSLRLDISDGEYTPSSL